MKKLLQIFVLLLTIVVVYNAGAQTFVGTDPQPRNAVLEEFTGIYCGFCPQGHAIAKALMEQYPGRVIAINIHSGDSYSKPKTTDHPDFRNQWGPSLQQLSNLAGFPGGMVNRQLFTGSQYQPQKAGALCLSRGGWQFAVADVLNDENGSPLNIGAKTEWNAETKTLDIIVEVYFTKDVGQNVKLNVAFLQNSVIGYQGSGSATYDHTHILRDLITGQWGDEITTTSNGNLFTKTYSYSVEGKSWADVSGVADKFGTQFDIENCELVIFATQADNKYIYTGINIPAITPNLVLNTVGETAGAVNSGSDMTSTVEVSNNTEEEMSFSASVELSDRTPNDWTGSVIGETNYTIAAGEKAVVDFKLDLGSTLGIGDAFLNITEVGVENPLTYKSKITVISKEIEEFEVIPEDEKKHSILPYIPNNSTIFQVPIKDFIPLNESLTNKKVIIWNTGNAGAHDANSLDIISNALNGDVKVFLIGAQSLSTMTTPKISEFMLQYIGYSLEGYTQGTPSPWTATLVGFDADEISGNYTSGITTGWSSYPYFCFQSINDTKTQPFLGFKNSQTIYLSSTNYKTVPGDESNVAFRVQKGDNRAIVFGMDVFFIKDENIRKTLIENAYNWMIGTTDVNDNVISKGSLSISANPNPIESTTSINYSVANSQNVRISLCNELGQEVSIIFEGNVSAGSHSTTYSAKSLANGTYFMVMKSGTDVVSIPVVILK